MKPAYQINMKVIQLTKYEIYKRIKTKNSVHKMAKNVPTVYRQLTWTINKWQIVQQ